MFAFEQHHQNQPPSKRQRLHSHDVNANVDINEPHNWEEQPLVPPPAAALDHCQWSPPDSNHHQFHESNSHSPLSSASWYMYHDGFSHNPGYLASQEELRCMLFTFAQSAAPTRVGSPVLATDDDRHDEMLSSRDTAMSAMKLSALSNGKRIRYLQNYVAQVAPWVCTYINF